jgi:hypothetical protein
MSVTVTIPTAVSIKTRFPEFVNVSDANIEFAIEEARLEVGSNWTVGYDLAIVYLVAHYVASATAETARASAGGEVASESIGRLSVSYAQSSNAEATHADYESTSYGQRFLEIQAKNFGGPQVI